MIDYSNDKKILDLMSTYKNHKKQESQIKEKEKQLIKSDAVKNFNETYPEVMKVFDENSIGTDVLEEFLNMYEESKKNIGAEKKEIKEDLLAIANAIGEIIEKDVADNQKEKTIILNKLGTVKCTFEKEYYLAMTEEEKTDFISECFNEGYLNLLKINEEELFKHSQRIKDQTGNHIEGVGEKRNIVTKITTART